jgi:hypothetical protein
VDKRAGVRRLVSRRTRTVFGGSVHCARGDLPLLIRTLVRNNVTITQLVIVRQQENKKFVNIFVYWLGRVENQGFGAG